MKKLYHVNIDQRKIGIAILISDTVRFRGKLITKDKGEIYKDKSVSLPRSLPRSDPKCE